MTAADIAETGRIARTAATWVKKAAGRLHWSAENAPNAELRWLAGYDAARLLEVALAEAELLVATLNDDEVDEALRRARKLTEKLRARRLAAKLENVTGRTPEEAASFQAKAAALRATPPA